MITIQINQILVDSEQTDHSEDIIVIMNVGYSNSWRIKTKINYMIIGSSMTFIDKYLEPKFPKRYYEVMRKIKGRVTRNE